MHHKYCTRVTHKCVSLQQWHKLHVLLKMLLWCKRPVIMISFHNDNVHQHDMQRPKRFVNSSYTHATTQDSNGKTHVTPLERNSSVRVSACLKFWDVSDRGHDLVLSSPAECQHYAKHLFCQAWHMSIDVVTERAHGKLQLHWPQHHMYCTECGRWTLSRYNS